MNAIPEILNHMDETVAANATATQALADTAHFTARGEVAIHRPTGITWVVLAPENDNEKYMAYRTDAHGEALESWYDREGEFVEAQDIDSLAAAIHATR